MVARANVDDLEASVFMVVFDIRHEEVWSSIDGGHEMFSVGWFQVTQKDANLILFDELDVAVRTDAFALASLALV